MSFMLKGSHLEPYSCSHLHPKQSNAKRKKEIKSKKEIVTQYEILKEVF